LRLKEKVRFLQYRRFQVHILTIVLSLLLISSVLIITYTYIRQKESMLHFSKNTIYRVATIINEELTDLANITGLFPEISSGFFLTDNPLKKPDSEILPFFLSSIKYHPQLYAVFAADMNGNFLGAFNLHLMNQKTFLSMPTTPLPEGTEFCVIQQTPQGKECRQYKDKSFKTIGSECYQKLSFVPRIRPWFQEALASKELVWSDIYQFRSSDDIGFTASKAMLTNGVVSAVVAADVTSDHLSRYISGLTIGKTGKAYVIDGQNKILLPSPSSIDQDLVGKILKKVSEHEATFVNTIEEIDGTDYLVSLMNTPINQERGWKLLIYAPFSDFFSEMIDTQKKAFGISLIVLGIASLFALYFSKRISTPIITLSEQVDKIKQLDFSNEVRIHSNIKEIAQMSDSIHSLRTALIGFSRYVPKTIVMQLMKTAQGIELGGNKENLTVLFSDIQDFTHISEKMPTDDLMKMLAIYFNGVSEIILEGKGTIDKYIGDSIMAFWGAPLHQEDHSFLCCSAVLRSKKFIDAFNLEQTNKGAPCFYTRFGVHCGDVIVGNIGTKERMNYTVIGDVVNTSSRLQGLNKTYHTFILISETVNETISKQFYTRAVDKASLKGKDVQIVVYELLDFKKDPLFNEASYYEELISNYNTALKALQENRPEAKELFTKLAKTYPHDHLIEHYLKLSL